jgi:nucleolar protein 15
MVETKAAKRKGAQKVARRAAHELHAEVKKTGKEKKLAEKKASEPARDNEMLNALAQAEKDGSGSESDGEGFDGQRLVVKLGPSQKQRLTKGLKDIAAKPAVKEDPGESSVIFLGRIPFGFFEDQMQAYFKQFGEVKRLRLSRNKKTGKSKHFAFIEFEHPEVAEIVASTHNNMLICDRAIKCAVVPKSKQHSKLWRGADEKFTPHNFKYAAKVAVSRKRGAVQEKAREKKLVKKEQQKRKKLEGLGIDYDFTGYENQVAAKKPKRMKFSE